MSQPHAQQEHSQVLCQFHVVHLRVLRRAIHDAADMQRHITGSWFYDMTHTDRIDDLRKQDRYEQAE